MGCSSTRGSGSPSPSPWPLLPKRWQCADPSPFRSSLLRQPGLSLPLLSRSPPALLLSAIQETLTSPFLPHLHHQQQQHHHHHQCHHLLLLQQHQHHNHRLFQLLLLQHLLLLLLLLRHLQLHQQLERCFPLQPLPQCCPTLKDPNPSPNSCKNPHTLEQTNQ